MAEKRARDTVGKTLVKKQKRGTVKFLNFHSLFSKVDNLDNCISFCRSYNLLPKSVKCPTCGDELTKLYEIRRKTTKTVDYRFQCNKKFCKSGRNQVQLKKGSWFEGAKISYRKSILLAYCFLNKLTYKHAIQETSISSTDDSDEERVLVTSSETVSDYYNYCREVCSRIVENESSKPIGGEGCTVEVDEAKFGKRKYQRGRIVEGQWVLGGICRETRQVFLVPVERRDGATLIAIIEEYVAPNTHIVTDCWKGYDGLLQSRNHYTHSTVNHSQNFVGKYNTLTLALGLALTLTLT